MRGHGNVPGLAFHVLSKLRPTRISTKCNERRAPFLMSKIAHPLENQIADVRFEVPDETITLTHEPNTNTNMNMRGKNQHGGHSHQM